MNLEGIELGRPVRILSVEKSQDLEQGSAKENKRETEGDFRVKDNRILISSWKYL